MVKHSVQYSTDLSFRHRHNLLRIEQVVCNLEDLDSTGATIELNRHGDKKKERKSGTTECKKQSLLYYCSTEYMECHGTFQRKFKLIGHLALTW